MIGRRAILALMLAVTATGAVAAPEPAFAPVRSIVPDDTDWSDLAPLGRAIAGRRIVLLGEASHGDGASFVAKARLIRYLNEVHGFTVVAFESGLFEMDAAERRIARGAPPSAVLDGAVFPLWAQASQFRPLLDWLDANRRSGRRKMHVAGIDFQLTGALGDTLPGVLRDAGRRTGAPAAFATLADGIALVRRDRMTAAKALDPVALETARAAALAAVARSKPRDRAWLAQVVEGVGRFLLFAQGVAAPTPDLLDSREVRMADNLRYLADVAYPGRRIVVWGATSHLLRRRDGFASDGAATMKPAGAHIAERYGDGVYVLALTSSDGRIGRWSTRGTTALPPAPAGSLEAAFAATGMDHGFASLPRDWSGTSTMLGHVPMAGPWGRSVDGVLVLRTQAPATYPPRP